MINKPFYKTYKMHNTCADRECYHPPSASGISVWRKILPFLLTIQRTVIEESQSPGICQVVKTVPLPEDLETCGRISGFNKFCSHCITSLKSGLLLFNFNLCILTPTISFQKRAGMEISFWSIQRRKELILVGFVHNKAAGTCFPLYHACTVLFTFLRTIFLRSSRSSFTFNWIPSMVDF